MQRFDAPRLAEYLQRASPLLLDVREPWEFEICHIDGSVNIPMGQIPSELARIDDAAEVVVICHHGIRSRQVARYLEQQSEADFINLEGGVDAWARSVDPDMPVY